MGTRAAVAVAAAVVCVASMLSWSTASAQNVWPDANFTDRFKPAVPDHDSQFGSATAVSLDGNLVVVALEGYEDQSNWIEFYERADSAQWVGPQRIQTNGGDFGPTFGHLIEITDDGQTVVV